MTDAYARPIVDQATAPGGVPAPGQQADDTVVLPSPTGQEPGSSTTRSPRQGGVWGRDLRFMLVVLAAIVALFLAFVLVIAFSPSGVGVSALAVVAAPIATMVAAYYGISLALRQVADARRAAESADTRARVAEASARESDAWAAQMESGLRVAVAKLQAAGVSTRDVERAAGTPDEFF